MGPDRAPSAPATLQHPTFPPELLDEFVRLGPTQRYARGTIIINEGDAADSLYVIREGELCAFVTDDEGREVTLNRLGRGETLGEMMLDGHTRSASVRCVTAATLTRIRRAEFEQILAERPDIAFRLIQGLIFRVRLLSRDVQGLVSLDVYGRLVKLFESLAETTAEGGRRVPGGWSQRKLAERVGASPSMVNRVLKELAAGEYIGITPQGIELLRPLPRRW